MTSTSNTTPEDNSFDLLFVIDCTGSMGAWMNQAKENILAVYDLVQKDLRILFGENNSKLRAGVVAYRDFNSDGSETADQFETLDLNDDVAKTKAFLMGLQPSGGDDFPEDVAGGLEIAASKISWAAKYKLIVHVADAPAHGKAYCDGHDSFPNGHPKRKELSEVVADLAKMGIFYTLFHISNATEKMGSAFQKVYATSATSTTTEKAPIRASYRGLKIVGDATEFFSFVMQSVRGVLNENGAVSLATTGSKPLDLFSKTVRNVPEEQLLTLLDEAWAEDPLTTLKIVFYSRDVRGGKGERKIFETAMNWLIKKNPETFLKNLELIPEYGRFDDLVRLLSTTDEKVSSEICQFIAKTLKSDVEKMKETKSVSLCAKWAPTEGGKFDKANKGVKKICAALGVNKKQYRKEYLAPLRAYIQIVERFMCAKEWNKINYEAVPSVAMHKLKKAFAKNDTQRFNEFKQKLQKGEAKVNSSTLHPHMIVEKYLKGQPEDVVAEEQWKGIVKKTAELGSLAKTLVLSDVSASMNGEPMNVSIALGILISELSQPPFQNLVITFEENPKFHALTPGGSLYTRVLGLKQSSWGPGTDFMAVFDLVLTKALEQQLPQSEMPDRIIVISDMQFNLSGRKTNFESVKEKFQSYGYQMPKLVFWNTRGDTKDFTNSASDSNVAMVSGFSPSILQAVIEDSAEFTPLSIMRKSIDAERYKKIELAN